MSRAGGCTCGSDLRFMCRVIADAPDRSRRPSSHSAVLSPESSSDRHAELQPSLRCSTRRDAAPAGPNDPPRGVCRMNGAPAARGVCAAAGRRRPAPRPSPGRGHEVGGQLLGRCAHCGRAAVRSVSWSSTCRLSPARRGPRLSGEPQGPARAIDGHARGRCSAGMDWQPLRLRPGSLRRASAGPRSGTADSGRASECRRVPPAPSGSQYSVTLAADLFNPESTATYTTPRSPSDVVLAPARAVRSPAGA